jgi:hypothetical protein
LHVKTVSLVGYVSFQWSLIVYHIRAIIQEWNVRERGRKTEREREREGEREVIKRKKKRNDCPLHSIIECNRKNKAHEPSKETEKRKTDTDRNKSRQWQK